MTLILTVVESKPDRARLQRQLEAQIKNNLQNRGDHNIGFPGGNANADLYSNGHGQLWAAFDNLSDAAIPKRWNAFGIYNSDTRSQEIAVEINIPTDVPSGRIAGFFAKDIATGHEYLMHGGRIGGGKPGVGKQAFLTHSKLQLYNAEQPDSASREGIIIGRIDQSDLTSRIWSFVQQVSEFKKAVRNGAFDSPEAKAAVQEWDSYKDEATGRRQGNRKSVIDYITYHGDVVRKLRDVREAQCGASERVLNSQLIDLYVKCADEITEVYEVKTSVNRQSIYTAIGQLMTHGPADRPSVKRILALPPGEIARDLERCLSALGITIQRYDITDDVEPQITLI